MPLVRLSSTHHSITRGAALVVIAIASGGAGCPGGTNDTEAGTDNFGTDGSSFGTDQPTSFGTDDPTDPSTTNPSTTNPSTTNPSTTEPSTTTPTTDPDTSDTDPSTSDTDPTGGTGCGSGGPFVVNLVDLNDLYGHLQYLLLFYPEDPPTPETFDILVGEDGTITVDFFERSPGSGSGHSGLTGLTGTIDGACTVSIDTEVEFVSDTGPFGTIQVIIDGTFPAAADGPVTGTMTLQGGNIPNGPITYTFEGQ